MILYKIFAFIIIIALLFSSCDNAPEELRDAAKEYDALATLEFKKDIQFKEGVNEIEFGYTPRTISKNFKFRLYFPLIIGDTIDYYFKNLETGILPFIDGMRFKVYDTKNKLLHSYTYKLKDTVYIQGRPSAGVSLGVKVPLKKNQLYRLKLIIPDNSISDEKLSKGQLIIGLGWSFAYL